jgi:uncharacterized protein (DUF2236 family)
LVQAAFKVNRERVAILGWGRAILLQIAHPLVGAGVSEHSGFAEGRLSRLGRLHATVGAMLAFSFGSPEDAKRTAGRINAIHQRVHGVLEKGTRHYPAGTRYSATDPRLLLWVHATLLESMPMAYELLVGPLSQEERDDYCLQSMSSARMLGLPESMLPRSGSEVQDYIRRTIRSGEIEVTGAARGAARQLLYPPLLDPTRAGAPVTRLLTIGMLPPEIREAYGFGWGPGREAALKAFSKAVRGTLPIVPSALRYWRSARTSKSRQLPGKMPEPGRP